MEEEVLADRLDALQTSAVEPAGDVQRFGTRMRGFDLDALTHESLQATSSAMDAVPLGHLSAPYQARSVLAGELRPYLR